MELDKILSAVRTINSELYDCTDLIELTVQSDGFYIGIECMETTLWSSDQNEFYSEDSLEHYLRNEIRILLNKLVIATRKL